jgi:anti-sigma regulatory factor (Ser/Thr protein kinase)
VVRLTLAHNPAEMARLAAWLDAREHQMAIPAKLAFAVRQCLEEVVANLINHTPATAGEDIAVELDWQADTLIAAVEDSAPPFDPRAVPPPVRPATLESAVPGGWGIHLIRSFANDIDYDTKAGRNRLTMKFARPAPAADARLGEG